MTWMREMQVSLLYTQCLICAVHFCWNSIDHIAWLVLCKCFFAVFCCFWRG
jgi:hypothetical protein